MNIKATIFGAAMGALGLVGADDAALAGTTTPPGERAGIDLATPLPEGIYFVDLGGIGNDRGSMATSNFDYNVPIIAWATPWTIGARPHPARSSLLRKPPLRPRPTARLPHSAAYIRGMYNPFVAGQYRL